MPATLIVLEVISSPSRAAAKSASNTLPTDNYHRNLVLYTDRRPINPLHPPTVHPSPHPHPLLLELVILVNSISVVLLSHLVLTIDLEVSPEW